MEQNNHAENKKKLFHDPKFKAGRNLMMGGIFFLLFGLYFLPFHADNVCEIREDELKKWKAYYIENLQVLHAKIDDVNDSICCVAKFYDVNQNAWIISFIPDGDEQLVNQIKDVRNAEYQRRGIIYDEIIYTDLDLETSGYFYMEDIPSEASSYYSITGREYTGAEGGSILEMNADYLCEEGENYTLKALLRPGYALGGLVLGLFAVIGGLVKIKKQTRKSEAT